LDAESIGVLHVETLRALFVRLRLHTACLQVSNDRIVIEFVDPQSKVINVPRRLFLSQRQVARANAQTNGVRIARFAFR
jgi:hypothetical protein